MLLISSKYTGKVNREDMFQWSTTHVGRCGYHRFDHIQIIVQLRLQKPKSGIQLIHHKGYSPFTGLSWWCFLFFMTAKLWQTGVGGFHSDITNVSAVYWVNYCLQTTTTDFTLTFVLLQNWLGHQSFSEGSLYKGLSSVTACMMTHRLFGQLVLQYFLTVVEMSLCIYVCMAYLYVSVLLTQRLCFHILVHYFQESGPELSQHWYSLVTINTDTNSNTHT